jgi:predicted phosphohydrolase
MNTDFQLLSDLHLDMHKDAGVSFLNSIPVASDILVIPGDVAECASLEATLRFFCARWKDTIFCAGNHEYYSTKAKSDVDKVLTNVKADFPNFHWLNKSSVTLGGVTFHGATLWFPNKPDHYLYRYDVADFQYIPGFEPWVYNEHTAAVKYFRKNVKEGDVLITHHLPSEACVSPRFRGDPLNRFFVGEIDTILRENKPAVSAFGHTHDPIDIKLFDTRVICNPLGYPREGGYGFQPACVVTV